MTLIENLQWRYATKQFDSSKKVSQPDMDYLKESIRLSASSYGLQPYKVLIIENEAVKEQLKPASYNQSQITEASHLIVFCQYNAVDDGMVDDFMRLTAEVRGLNPDDLKGFGDYIKGTLSNFPSEMMKHWTAKQTYIALGNVLAAAAERKIDTCPMEGFEAEKYNAILDLESKGLNASVIVAVGYRSTDDQAQFETKVRKSNEDLFITI